MDTKDIKKDNDINYSVAGYTVNYPSINLDLMKNNKLEYDKMIITVYAVKLYERMYVKKQYKTNKKGTQFKLDAIQTNKQLKNAIKTINDMVDTVNKEHDVNIEKIILND